MSAYAAPVTVAGTADVVVAASTATIAVLVLAGGAGLALLFGRTRRKWRMWRAVPARTRRRQVLERGVAAVAAAPVSHPGWWLVQRDRHRLWRAVTAAERAVGTAAASGVPVGDLPALTRRLRRRAESADDVLRASGGTPPSNARAAVTELVQLADQVRAAATDALLTVSQDRGSGLAEAIAVEVTALRHGLAAFRSSYPG